MAISKLKEEEIILANKNEFLQDLIKGFVKWGEREPEYALAYQRLLNVFTTEIPKEV